MPTARFEDPAGSIRHGTWTANGIQAGGRTYDPDAVRVLPPVEPDKILGVAYNFQNRWEASDDTPPERPGVWLKGGRNVLCGHGDTVTIPAALDVIWEAELAVVIGEQCRGVSEAEALDVVGGYTVANDLSNRTHLDDETMYRIKAFDNACPLGPALASPEEVPDDPRIRMWLNGEKRQDSRDDDYVFGIREVIAEASAYTTLESDDVILMGTPGGADLLSDGDHVAIEVEGVGRLEHDVAVR